jgi:O-antigen/teichoic acid export membrane protein
MGFLRSILTIAGASFFSQLIGAFTLWLISHQYGMGEVGHYALTYSVVLIGAQVCTFASQLLLPKVSDDDVAQNVAFCFVLSGFVAVIYAVILGLIFKHDMGLFFFLTLAYAWVLISENLFLRKEKMRPLALQRIAVSVLVLLALVLTPNALVFYWVWSLSLLVLLVFCLRLSLKSLVFSRRDFSPKNLIIFVKKHKHHLIKVGSAEVLAMANLNLPVILLNFWFSPVVAGYFAVVSRFCLAPVTIVANAVRNALFSRWSLDFRTKSFDFAGFVKARRLLFILGLVATAGVFLFYPIVMHLGFSQQWIDSIPTSRYILPYLFPAMAICPLTVIELVFGSTNYFLQIQIEQLLIVALAFVVLPWAHQDYSVVIISYSVLSLIRYSVIYLRVNQRAHRLAKASEA